MQIALRIIDPKMTLCLPRVLIWPLFLCAQKLHALTYFLCIISACNFHSAACTLHKYIITMQFTQGFTAY